MASPEPEGFTPANRLRPLVLAPVGEPEPGQPSLSLFVRPEVTLAQAKETWNAYFEFKEFLLSDPICFDEIDGTKEMNRTGATRLAFPFGLSIRQKEIHESRVQLDDSGGFDYRFIVTVQVGKDGRWVDGIGSCRLSEITTKNIDDSKREHFALTRAWTRAAKRAIADILGGVEAE